MYDSTIPFPFSTYVVRHAIFLFVSSLESYVTDMWASCIHTGVFLDINVY